MRAVEENNLIVDIDRRDDTVAYLNIQRDNKNLIRKVNYRHVSDGFIWNIKHQCEMTDDSTGTRGTSGGRKKSYNGSLKNAAESLVRNLINAGQI
jgi:hypothetical protein